MSDLSSIQTPSGETFNLKDAAMREAYGDTLGAVVGSLQTIAAAHATSSGIYALVSTPLTMAHDEVQLIDRAVQCVQVPNGTTSLTLVPPAAVAGRIRDFILDVDNSANTGALGIEFNLLGEDYALAVTDGDNLTEITELAAGERARFYFTETAQRYTPSGVQGSIPVISIQRMTIEVVTTQGGA